MILLLAASFTVLTQIEFFAVKKIVVDGNSELSKNKIIATSGIVIGENIFKVDIKSVKENLLLHPYINNVKIKRKLPDKITIKIDEREETAYIKYMNSYVYLGFDGLVLDISKLKKKNKVPMISNLTIASPSIGSKISFKKRNEKETQQIANMLKISAQKGMKNQIKSIELNNKNINIILNSGVKVAFGPPTNIEYKMTFLLNVLKDLKQKNLQVESIYLNKGDDIIVEVVNSLEEDYEKK